MATTSRRRARAADGTGGRPARGLRQALAPFRYRDYAIFWVGGLLSNVARWMQDAIVPYVIYRLTRSPGLVGVGAFARFAPGVLVAPLAGSIADRFDRKTVLIASHLGLAGISGVFWLVWITGAADAPLLIVLAAVAGSVVGLTLTAWHAFLPELVPREHLFGAITLNSAHVNAAKAIGPSVAGVILATAGATWAFSVTALLFAGVVGALVLVRARRREAAPTGRRVLGQFVDVLRYAGRRPALVVCGLVMLATAVLGMPVVQLTPVFATEVFGVEEAGYGILAGALGFGGVVAAPILSAWTRGIARSRLIAASLLWYALSLVVFANSTHFAAGVVAMAFVGGGFLFVNSTVSTTVQLAVDDAVRGRIIAIFLTGFAAAYPLGALVQGWIAEKVGAPATVTGAGALLAGSALAFLASGSARASLDQPPAEEAEVVAAYDEGGLVAEPPA